ncbi:MAG: hypothetical protein IJ706_01340 [Clostridia bacterium]|nr:hypothetical protein [Clostridia bacterium]
MCAEKLLILGAVAWAVCCCERRRPLPPPPPPKPDPPPCGRCVYERYEKPCGCHDRRPWDRF